MAKQLILAILVIIFIAPNLQAGNYRTLSKKQSAFAQGFAQRKFVEQFEFQNQDVNIDFVNDNDIIRAVAVPVTDFGVDFYYRIEPRLGEREIAERVTQNIERGVLKENNELLKRIVELLERLNQNGSHPKPQPKPTPEPSSIPDEVQNILINKCAVCHSADSPTKGYDFENFLFNDSDIRTAEKWKIFDQVDRGRMPKNASPLIQSEVDAIRKWAQQ